MEPIELKLGGNGRKLSKSIIGRVGDNRFINYPFKLLDPDGSTINLNGCTIVFYGTNANGTFTTGVPTILDPTEGEISYKFSRENFSVQGEFKEAFFRVTRENGECYATQSFRIKVENDADISQGQATLYVSLLDEKLKDFDNRFRLFIEEKEQEYKGIENVVKVLNEQVLNLNEKVNETSKQINELGNLKRMYSNSIDFGNYDYSGNANLLPKITAAHFTSGNGATVEDGPDGEIIFTLDGSAQLTKFNTSMRLPALKNGKRYTISAEIMLHEGLEGDASNIRLTNTYVPGGNIMLSTVRPLPTATNIWHTISGTQIATYATTLPQQWYVVLQDVTASSRIKGKISLRNIKIEEGSVATPYQPNLLVEPYHISKVPLNENLANKEQAFPISSRQYLVYSAEMIEPFIANQTYTLTLKGTKLGTQSFRVYTTGPNSTSNIGDMEIVEGLADTWRLTFTPSEVNLNGSVSPSTLQIYQFPQATMGQVTIESLKIEKGDIATPNILEYKYFGEGLKDSSNPNDYSWDITEEYLDSKILQTVSLNEPQQVPGFKNFLSGLQSNGVNIGVEYAKAVATDKYKNHGAVYLGGCVWLAWETLEFSNSIGWARGSTIRVGNDGHPGFTYPDVPNIFGGYIWIGGSCLPDYTDGGFGSYHITVSNNFDDARKPIVRFIDSPTTLVKRLAVRGHALVFAPAPTNNSKVEEV
ncbi:BppU family phage baseplate upper protein [Enterococcus mundtii]|uniref:BppU family phage baseplate upper protein n=1 Tax=Enterococcus mundtii TaxID=53346 RepID=UPI001CCD85EA|nr:BppU family phage baseplate upper protein [Enterococcus mundtii]UBM05119.1 phage baseplate upper protein [Enterococcus mundtii]